MNGNSGAGNEARTRDLNLGKIARGTPEIVDFNGFTSFSACNEKINSHHVSAIVRRLIGLPFSGRPRLRVLPDRLCAAARAERLERILSRCTKLPSGCLLYPAVRDEAYPYIDLQGDHHDRQQWSARRLVWALVNGPLPERGILFRRCVPKNCVTPAHQTLWVPPEQIDWIGDSISDEFYRERPARGGEGLDGVIASRSEMMPGITSGCERPSGSLLLEVNASVRTGRCKSGLSSYRDGPLSMTEIRPGRRREVKAEMPTYEIACHSHGSSAVRP